MRRICLLAVACASLAAQTVDPAVDRLNQGYEAIRAGDLARAIVLIEEARDLAPDRVQVHQELGYLYLKVARLEEARAAFETALQLQADDPTTTLQLAYMYHAAGDTLRARALFTRVAKVGLEEQAEAALEALAQLEGAGAPPPTEVALGYEALGDGRYDDAIAAFEAALASDPDQPSVAKELAYVLLKTGETERARGVFERAVLLDPSDERAALELAFLRYETDQRERALAEFQALEDASDPAVRQTAAATARRIEAELADSAGRWELAVERDPSNRSARLELAELYQRAGDAKSAARQYLEAWRLPGSNRDEILLDLGRARKQAKEPVPAHGAWLLAAQSDETRVAETAKDLLPARFPWANEFRAALEIDPQQQELRKELGYLLLQVGLADQALKEFQRAHEQDPNDLQTASQLSYLYLDRNEFDRAVRVLERARLDADPETAERAQEAIERIREQRTEPLRQLGEKSLERSYLNDAKRLFEQAYALNPHDYASALKLGVVHNLLQEDRKAIRWFEIAAQSQDEAIAAQAQRSYAALAPQYQRATTTVWFFPFYSKRFDTIFGYGQAKTEFRVGNLPFRPYVSLRLAGDTRQQTGGETPQLLSESALIAAIGARASLPGGVTLWGEAGEAINYLDETPAGVPRAAPDYRGGLNWFRANGPTLHSGEPGWFWESNLDLVYVSRFDDDVLAYWQFKPGYSLPQQGPLQTQLYLNWNVTVDASREYWANYAEMGPGIRFRSPRIRPPIHFFVDVVRGVHLSNRGNIRGPNYNEIRAGFWFSFAK